MNNKKPSPQINKQPLPERARQKKETIAEKEIGGFEDSDLKEPTRFGDWEVNGRCSDF